MMSEAIQQIFDSFNGYLNTVLDSRKDIHIIVKELAKSSRGILMILQNIHNDNKEENTISHSCAKARELFTNIRTHYAKLAEIVPMNKYYLYHDQWKFETQKLCFLSALTVYLEIKVLVTKEAVAEILGVKSMPGNGFHLDVEDFLAGLLQLAPELTRFAVNSVRNGEFNRPVDVARVLNELNDGFRLINPRNDFLQRRFDALKYEVKKVEEVVYDLSIRGLKPENAEAQQETE